ncbi:hypothetical protein [Ferrimonas balearica]|uniref:hypothetical protein n=1 Tax=Ferrimonas balearica TaxID=44012 RepID=UPI001C5767DA|nr:hypothetical protein [Ferrimonas balearica]MBW3139205.1 hypothetical protein [Ferrimonas balearica]MBW3163206.1 hypothetical protein [Ferrimonas balearica]MBY5980899.1 hypothetical protein [Ferrimonas balearica]MBY6106269.1 hypothetical protein [Ferrimonas balearica]MBY6223152.1 hypothetical protein [Ferrimonas balearica]
MAKSLSTTALAKRLELPTKTLFERLARAGFLVREAERWCLTEQGRLAGGRNQHSDKFGEYVVWPETLKVPSAEGLLSVSKFSESTGLGRESLLGLLHEIGYLAPAPKGWRVTESGAAAGGVQQADRRNGAPYSLWPAALETDPLFKRALAQALGKDADKESTHGSIASFRAKFDAKYRTLDGHYVRSVAELTIDNWLYLAGLVHAYERPVRETLGQQDETFCSFFLPRGAIYIDYVEGLDADTLAARQSRYRQLGLKLIQLHLADLDNLDEVLPRRLLAFGIEVY